MNVLLLVNDHVPLEPAMLLVMLKTEESQALGSDP